MMPNTNYDTRPVAQPFFGSERTERSKHFHLLVALGAWLFAAGAAASTGWWVWLIAERWDSGVAGTTATNATVVGVGVVALALWTGTLLLVRSWRRR